MFSPQKKKQKLVPLYANVRKWRNILENYLWVSRLNLPLKADRFMTNISFTRETVLKNEVHFGPPHLDRLCHPLRVSQVAKLLNPVKFDCM